MTRPHADQKHVQAPVLNSALRLADEGCLFAKQNDVQETFTPELWEAVRNLGLGGLWITDTTIRVIVFSGIEQKYFCIDSDFAACANGLEAPKSPHLYHDTFAQNMVQKPGSLPEQSRQGQGDAWHGSFPALTHVARIAEIDKLGANAVLFFASDQSGFVTGRVLSVSRGLTMV